MTIINFQKLFATTAMLAVFGVLLITPESAHAIEIAFAGVTDQDDIITVIIKVLSAVLRLVIAVLGVIFFIAGAYVILTSIWDVSKGRETAGDVVGKIMLSLVAIVVGLFFLNFSEDAVTQLAESTTVLVEPAIPNTVSVA